MARILAWFKEQSWQGNLCTLLFITMLLPLYASTANSMVPALAVSESLGAAFFVASLCGELFGFWTVLRGRAWLKLFRAHGFWGALKHPVNTTELVGFCCFYVGTWCWLALWQVILPTMRGLA